jgi:hypothetical protein
MYNAARLNRTSRPKMVMANGTDSLQKFALERRLTKVEKEKKFFYQESSFALLGLLSVSSLRPCRLLGQVWSLELWTCDTDALGSRLAGKVFV